MGRIKLHDEYGDEIRPKQIEETKKRIDYEFWLSPLGKIVKYPLGVQFAYDCFSLHGSIAYEVVKKLLGEKYADDCRDCEKILFANGWIKIGCLGQRYDIAKKEPTQAQLTALFDLDIKELFIEDKLTKVL